MRSYSRIHIGFWVVIAAALGFALGLVAQDRPVSSQERREVIPLARSEFDSPKAPILNYFYALTQGDSELANACFDRDDMPSIDFSAIDRALPIFSVTGVRFESRRELTEDRFEIRAMPVGDEWEQRIPDVYTVEKAGDRWVIHDILQYGPADGAYGRFDAAAAPDPEVDPLLGVWLNENSATSDITRIELSIEDNRLVARVWGSCSPFDCFWGEAYAEVSASEPRAATVVYVKTFSNMHLGFRLDQDRLTCTSTSVFKDTSGRVGREVTETFERR
jgi:hypothetical protein